MDPQRWQAIMPLLQQVKVKGNANNRPVTIQSYPQGLRCIGIGTDAAVFYCEAIPELAFKFYTPQAIDKKETEAYVYQCLKGSIYFPIYYGSGENFLVMSYEQGVTLYDCLMQGIKVPKRVMEDVEAARQYVREQGLNPRDIHLKNVLLQQGRGKVLDVSEYVKSGSDHRWEHLEWAYHRLYPMIAGVRLPSWLLETIKQWYNRMNKATLLLEKSAVQVKKLFLGKRK